MSAMDVIWMQVPSVVSYSFRRRDRLTLQVHSWEHMERSSSSPAVIRNLVVNIVPCNWSSGKQHKRSHRWPLPFFRYMLWQQLTQTIRIAVNLATTSVSTCLLVCCTKPAARKTTEGLVLRIGLKAWLFHQPVVETRLDCTDYNRPMPRRITRRCYGCWGNTPEDVVLDTNSRPRFCWRDTSLDGLTRFMTRSTRYYIRRQILHVFGCNRHLLRVYSCGPGTSTSTLRFDFSPRSKHGTLL